VNLPGVAGSAVHADTAEVERRRYSLVLSSEPDVIPRITGMCARKRARVVSLSFTAAELPSGDAALEIEVEVPRRHGRSLRNKLDGLIQVRSIIDVGLAQDRG
jgi:acetolactate synthase small subunit